MSSNICFIRQIAKDKFGGLLLRNDLLTNFRGQEKFIMNTPVERRHLEITAKHVRHDITSPAVVVKITQESKLVRGIKLKVEHPEFIFKAGQWLDTFIPGIKEVGGFSICSSPCVLGKLKTVDLAVKHAHRAPANWFYSECKVGSKLEVRAGGDFHFCSQTATDKDCVLLIAGGVGVNPLSSIFQYCADLHRAKDPITPKKVLLLFSAKSPDDVLFKDIFSSISKEIPSMNCKFFLTGETPECTFPAELSRITKQHLQEAVDHLGNENITCYICGPLAMINDMKTLLATIGIPENKLLYEKWW